MDFKPINVLNTPETPLYFTSDLHFFHKKIIEFTNRPTVFEELSEWIVKQCNSKIVEQNATVMHLGDMFFKCTNEEAVEVLSKLNGNWYFILGNHDNPDKLLTVVNTVNALKKTSHTVLGHYQKVLVKTPSLVEGAKMHKKLVVLCHFPIEDWDSRSRNSYMIHGHIHGNTSDHGGYAVTRLPNRFDVGLDNSHTFSPFSFSDIRRIMHKTCNGVVNPYSDEQE